MRNEATIQDEIKRALAQLLQAAPTRLKIRLISAEPLEQNLKDQLVASLRHLEFPDGLGLNWEVDPGLLQGYILWLNDICIDHSLKNSLAKLADDLHSKKFQAADAKNYSEPEVTEAGTVVSTADGIALAEGLTGCVNGELIVFGEDRVGVAMNLERSAVGIMLLCPNESVRAGDRCARTGTIMSVPAGPELAGRVVNPLGEALDGRPLRAAQMKRYPLETPAPPIVERAPVKTPLYTGITAIDAMVPIGRGQRELIIGDRQTGKTTLAVDTIINQKGQGVDCIYVAIGQKISTVAGIVATLEKTGALGYTTVVVAGAADPPGLQYLAPYAGCAIAEERMAAGRDVLIVYDDLTRHAQAYRAISLLLRRPPGREAFPGDVFYIHARLLERAAQLNPERGGGSITALPIVETQAGDISAYVPTNVISITDGQIYLETDLFFAGQRPAINVGLSVSRVGGDAQTKAMRKIAGPLRVNLAQYREKQSFAQFGSDVDAETLAQLERGRRLYELLKQGPEEARTPSDSVALLLLANDNTFKDEPVSDLRQTATAFLGYLRSSHKDLYARLGGDQPPAGPDDEALKEAWSSFKQTDMPV